MLMALFIFTSLLRANAAFRRMILIQQADLSRYTYATYTKGGLVESVKKPLDLAGLQVYLYSKGLRPARKIVWL